MEHFDVDLVAVLVASLAWFVLGWLWYSVLFKKAWTKGMGLRADMQPTGAEMAKSMGLGLVGILLSVAVFAWLTAALFADVAGSRLPVYLEGAGWVWLGFFLPRALGAVAWEGRPWSVALINTAHDLVGLGIVAAILALWP